LGITASKRKQEENGPPRPRTSKTLKKVLKQKSANKARKRRIPTDTQRKMRKKSNPAVTKQLEKKNFRK